MRVMKELEAKPKAFFSPASFSCLDEGAEEAAVRMAAQSNERKIRKSRGKEKKKNLGRQHFSLFSVM